MDLLELIATGVARAMTVYLAVGVLVAVPFVLVGSRQIDHGADGGGWGFKLLILPGSVALWPVLCSKWLRATRKQAVEHP